MADSLGLVVLAPDAGPLPRLGASIRAHNVDDLPVRVARTDEQVAPVLDLWRTTDWDACVVVAPTVEFVRPFGRGDFVRDDGTPYAVVSEEAERRVEGAPDLVAADAARETAQRVLGVADRRRFVARGVSVVATAALRSFHDEVLVARGWSYAEALAECPDELAWYHAWLLAGAGVSFVPHEPLVAALDTPGRRSDYRINAVTAADVARGYLGVLWPDDAWADHPTGPAGALAAGLPARVLSAAAVRRATRTVPRVQRWLRLR